MPNEKNYQDLFTALRNINLYFEKLHDKGCPEEVLLEGLKTPFDVIQRAAANSEAVTEKVLLEALELPNRDIRTDVAGNPLATEAVLLRAMDCREFNVRYAAVKNPSATDKVIEKALEEREGKIANAALSNPAASEELLLKAIEDGHYPKYLLSIVTNPSATQKVYLKALAANDISVNRLLLEDERYISEKLYLRALDHVANCKIIFIEKLGGSAPKLRENPAITPRVLKKALELYPRQTIAVVLHKNPVLGNSIQREYTVAQAVYNHPNSTDELRNMARRYIR